MVQRSILTALLCLWAASAAAQIALPPLPGLPRNALPVQIGPLLEGARTTADGATAVTRELRWRELLRLNRQTLERDPRGAPIVRSVILALSPDAAALARAVAAGYLVQQDQPLDALGERVVTLLAPRNLSTSRALAQLRGFDPRGSYDFDHLYIESAGAAVDVVPTGSTGQHVAAALAGAKIGLVDGGVAVGHPVFAGAGITTHGCSDRVLPSLHGTAVASLLVGQSATFQGASPQSPLFAADVYCDAASGGRVESIVEAMSWLVGENVRVVNLSLVGPANVVLEAIIKRVVARSIVVVAAVGNDGPAAKPLYPAAYPGVIAVTAVDARNRLLLETGRGAHLMFAAPGADMLAAASEGGYKAVRGSSFAAPLVAGLIATRLARSPDAPVQTVIDALAHDAEDLGRKGRDNLYGYGLVATQLRVPAAAGNVK